ncbi:hypothetical protein Ancab_018324 [Ancistrocladus abbreviatus]
MMKRNGGVLEKMLVNQKQGKKNKNSNNKRLLITVNVLGSTGPLRFLVNEDDLVLQVIDAALKMYAREGRLPVLGSDPNNFSLHSANADALNGWEKIGSSGARNFVMWKKAVVQPTMSDGGPELISTKGNGGWKTWLNKSFSLKISSH